MTREARVVSENGRLFAEVIRSEACAACHACEIGRKERVTYPLPDGKYAKGDTVEITIPDHTLTRASLWAYGVPLISLVIGLILGALLFDNEALQALCALICTLTGAAVIFITEKKRRKSGRYECAVSGSRPE